MKLFQTFPPPCFPLPLTLRSNSDQYFLILEVHRTHTGRHTTFGRNPSGRAISPKQRLLLDNTQHSQQTDIYAPGGIRTHNPSKRVAADPRLRPHGHRNRHTFNLCNHKMPRNDFAKTTASMTIVINELLMTAPSLSFLIEMSTSNISWWVKTAGA